MKLKRQKKKSRKKKMMTKIGAKEARTGLKSRFLPYVLTGKTKIHLKRSGAR